MRETCVRVLAAALLTAAIATVVGMSALFRTPSEAGRPISAPPSSLQRTVRLTAHLAPPHRQRTPELVTTDTNRSTSVRHEVISRSLVVRHKHRPSRRQLADVSPAAPLPAAAPAPPAPVSSPPPPPAQAQADEHGKGNGRGHAYGHEKQDE